MKTIRITKGNPNYEREISEILKQQERENYQLRRAYLEKNQICMEFDFNRRNSKAIIKQAKKKNYIVKQDFLEGIPQKSGYEFRLISTIELKNVWLFFLIREKVQ